VTGRTRAKARVLVAMSGGVDSSVAAALVKAGGDEANRCVDAAERLADSYSPFRRSCCSLDAAEDARRLPPARYPLLRHESRARVRGGRSPAIPAALSGSCTPSPCVDCNTLVSSGRCWPGRLTYRIEAVATGHYARVATPGDWRDGARPMPPRTPLELAIGCFAGATRNKDQSYFLYAWANPSSPAPVSSGRYDQTAGPDAARALGLATAEKRTARRSVSFRGQLPGRARERSGWQAEPDP